MILFIVKILNLFHTFIAVNLQFTDYNIRES